MMLKQLIFAVYCSLVMISMSKAYGMNVKAVAFAPHWTLDSQHQAIKRIVEGQNGLVVVDFMIQVERHMTRAMLDVGLVDGQQRKLDLPFQLRQGVWSQQKLTHYDSAVFNANRLMPLSLVDGGRQYQLSNLTPKRPQRVNFMLKLPALMSAQTLTLSFTVSSDDVVARVATVAIEVIELPKVKLDELPVIGIYQPTFESQLGLNKRLQIEQLIESNQVKHCERAFLSSLNLDLFYQSANSAHLSSSMHHRASKRFQQSIANYQQTVRYYRQAFPFEAFDDVAIEAMSQGYRRLAIAHSRLFDHQLQRRYRSNGYLADFALTRGYGRFVAEGKKRLVYGAEWFGDDLTRSLLAEQATQSSDMAVDGSLNVEDISRLQQQGLSPWFVNMSDKRLAAGFYLWRSKAAGYLQWQLPMSVSKEKQLSTLTDTAYSQRFIYNGWQVCNVDFSESYDASVVDFGLLAIDSQLLALALGARDFHLISLLQALSLDFESQLLANSWLDYFSFEMPESWIDARAQFAQQPKLIHAWRSELLRILNSMSLGES